MKISQKGIDLIKKYEGCVLHVYLDAVGVKTLGYGHTGADVNRLSVGTQITQSYADLMLIHDLAKFEDKVNKYNHIYSWTESEFDALVSFAFNIGSIDQLTANGTRSKSVIAKKMLEYNKAGGKVLPGLTKRRKAEHDLFCEQRILKRGMTGEDVLYVQKRLNELNILAGNVPTNGNYDVITENAVIAFQGIHNLKKDGICGPKTFEKLKG